MIVQIWFEAQLIVFEFDNDTIYFDMHSKEWRTNKTIGSYWDDVDVGTVVRTLRQWRQWRTDS